MTATEKRQKSPRTWEFPHLSINCGQRKISPPGISGKQICGQIAKKSSQLPPQEEIDKLIDLLSNDESQREAYDKERLQIQKEKEDRDEANKILKNVLSLAKAEYPKQTTRIKKEKALLKFLEKEEKTLSEKYEKLSVNVVAQKEYKSKIYKCPCCDNNLFINEGGDLALFDGENKPSDENKTDEVNEVRLKLGNIKEWVEKLRKIVPILDAKPTKPTIKYNYNKNLEDSKKIDEYKRLQREMSELKDLLDNNNLPPLIQSLFEELEILGKNFPKKFIPERELEKIEEEISEVSGELEEGWRVKSGWSSLTREINIRKKKVETIERSLKEKKFLTSSSRNSKKIQEEISQIQKDSFRCSTDLSELQEKFVAVSEYETHKRNLEEIENLKNEKENYITRSSQIKRKLNGAMGLEEASREAEILAMQATIESINEHAKFYLDKMFPNPIEVYLKGYKTTAKGEYRTQLNTVVSYRGDESSIDDLSGGEAQRCELAFLLAVNDMIGSPVILLDECLNNLDAEVNMETIIHLKELAEDKLIFVSSHEAVKGTFDQVIEL